MPLDGSGRPWRPIDFPDEVEEDDHIFRVRFTGEIFLSYNEYLDVLDEYTKRQWSCSVTGRCALTFEEALESEHTSRVLADLFPKAHIREALSLIHCSALNVEQLIIKLQIYFQAKFMNDKPLAPELQKEVLRSFILLNLSEPPTPKTPVHVKEKVLMRYSLLQPHPNSVPIRTRALSSTSRSETTPEVTKRTQPVAVGGANSRQRDKMAALLTSQNNDIPDIGPPKPSKDPDPFPELTGHLIAVWKKLNNSNLNLPKLTFQSFYEALQKASRKENSELLSRIFTNLLAVVLPEVEREIVIQSKRMPQFFRKISLQNWEEKMGVYLVAIEKIANKHPNQYDPVQDSYLGDCCRETGDDWLLSKLDVRAKILLLKFLSDQAEVCIKKHDNNETNKLKEEPKPKKHKPNSSSGNNGSTKSAKLTMDDNLVLELGPDGHGNEYVYIPTMPHYLFVTSSNYDVWLHYEQCKQVEELMNYLKCSHNASDAPLRENMQHLFEHMKEAMNKYEKAQQWIADHSVRRSFRKSSEGYQAS